MLTNFPPLTTAIAICLASYSYTAVCFHACMQFDFHYACELILFLYTLAKFETFHCKNYAGTLQAHAASSYIDTMSMM